MIINEFQELPDGRTCRVFPFHVSLEGLEQCVLCRDDEDFDVFVKKICLSSLKCNVVVVTYVVVSNHAHAVVLAESYDSAKAFGEELKRMYSQYFSFRYSERNVMIRTDVNVQYLYSEWYLRNALAYDARNALDVGSSIETYEWSGHRAMFRDKENESFSIAVASLSKREKEMTMRTNADLSSVRWRLDAEGRILPWSICFSKYLEDAFRNDQAYYLRTIGTVDMGEMSYRLVEGPRKMLVDAEFLKIAGDVCRRWYSLEIADLPLPKKIRLITYLYRVQRTSIPQLARAFGISREQVGSFLGVGKKETTGTI